tara:strand:- start:2224 stop:2811 length:588 start_codon:yes stop_codon:yes gene_type:complete
MEEHKVTDLPVVDESNKYLGMVSEDALLNAGDDTGTVQTALNLAYSPYVLTGSHPFEVLAIAAQYRLSVVPVLDHEGGYVSSYLLSDIVELFRDTPTLSQPGAILVLSIEESQYSMVTISTVIEQNDAKLLGLWMISPDHSGEVKFILKLNVQNSSPIVSSLQRYGYVLDTVHGDSSFELDYQNRYRHLMNYLKY